jgi:hypothetical protein
VTRQGAVKLANEMLKAKRLGWAASCDKKDDGIFVTLAEQNGGAQFPWSLCECGCLCACINPDYVKTADAAKMRFLVEHMIKDIRRANRRASQ